MPSAATNPKSSPPGNIRALLSAAHLHLQKNQLLEAAKIYFEVSQNQPHCFEAFCQLGVILNQLRQFDEACACLQNAVRLNPHHPSLNLFLGSIFKKLGRFAEAADCCRREMLIQPANADVHYNLGLVLQNLDQLNEAKCAYEKAIELRPDYPDALVNLGSVLRQQLQTRAALRCFEEVIRREPQNAEAHWELGTTLLALGNFERGWKEYEWRWRQNDFASPALQISQPRWDGSDLNGRRIFLHTEQGYGDTIQFVRYAALVARRGGEVILGCPPALRSLMTTVPGVSEVVTHRSNLPPFEVHAPLMSLPAIFETKLYTVPAEIPYLAPTRKNFAGEVVDDSRFKIGLVWAGDPAHKNDRNRSLRLEHFLPLLDLPRIRLYSLQVGNRVEDLALPKFQSRISDLGSRFTDFDDTAQAIAQMDLIIAVDTSVAHLAGALAKSVWTLLPFEAEWRWLVQREDSPWYPTMRLFRQKTPGDWCEVFTRLFNELSPQTMT